MDMKKVREKYPLWTYEDLMDLKAQFQTFDINQDGLIDFEELCSVLEEIGEYFHAYELILHSVGS